MFQLVHPLSIRSGSWSWVILKEGKRKSMQIMLRRNCLNCTEAFHNEVFLCIHPPHPIIWIPIFPPISLLSWTSLLIRNINKALCISPGNNVPLLLKHLWAIMYCIYLFAAVCMIQLSLVSTEITLVPSCDV